jgi:HEAT repeat protein
MGMIIKLTRVNDSAVANAAISALGALPSTESMHALFQLYTSADSTRNNIIADALLQVAYGYRQNGNMAAASEIFLKLFHDAKAYKLPLQIRRGVFLGVVQTAGDDALTHILAVLHSDDQDIKAAAISCIPDLKGEKITVTMMKELPILSPALAAMLIDALSTRADTSISPQLAQIAMNANSDPTVRIEALKALGKMGDASQVAMLVSLLESEDANIATAAGFVLRSMTAKGIEIAVMDQMKSVGNTTRSKLINVLADRQYQAAVPLLLEEAKSTDPELSYTAFRGLGMLATPVDLPQFVDLLLAQKDPKVRSYAESAVGLLASRAVKTGTGATVIYERLQSDRDRQDRISLLRVLKIMGDEQSYAAAEQMLNDPDDEVVDSAVRVLIDWPNALAEGRILQIIKTTSNPTYRVLAFRGYIRLLKQSDDPKVKILEKYHGAFSLAQNADEIKLTLSGLIAIEDYQALTMAANYINNKDLSLEASAASIKIAKAIVRLKENMPEIKAVMKKIISQCDDEKLRCDATAVIHSFEPLAVPEIAHADSLSDWDPAWEGYLVYKPHPAVDNSFFNGNDLKTWKDYKHPDKWSVSNRAIKGHSASDIIGQAFLWSPVEVRDFYLSIDVKLEPNSANAGIQFRSQRMIEKGDALGYQADIGETVWGRLYHEGGREKLDWSDRGEKEVKKGEWNHYEILAIGHYIWTAINGTLSVAIYDPEGETAGFIALQMHEGPPQTVYYRINQLIHNPPIRLAGMEEGQLFMAMTAYRKPESKSK